MSEFARGLRVVETAMQVQVQVRVPVIAPSRLNCGAKQRADEKTAISDLRESGSLELEADMVV